jgi:hypothetical protein
VIVGLLWNDCRSLFGVIVGLSWLYIKPFLKLSAESLFVGCFLFFGGDLQAEGASMLKSTQRSDF